MSSFTSEPKLQQTGETEDGNAVYQVLETFRYEVGYVHCSREICIKKGFKTNFASIPKKLQGIFSKDDPRWSKASIVHDYLYSGKTDNYQKKYSRYEADQIFFEAMRCNEKNPTPFRIALLFFVAVRIFGAKNFQK